MNIKQADNGTIGLTDSYIFWMYTVTPFAFRLLIHLAKYQVGSQSTDPSSKEFLK